MTFPLISSFGWINKDARIVILSRGVLTLGLGSLTLLLPIYLDHLGFTLVQIGFFLSAGAAGSAFFTFLAGFIGERVGRRQLLTIFTLLLAISGIALVFVDGVIPLMFISFVGGLSGGGAGSLGGPIQPLEQAGLPDTAPPQKRTDLFAIYRMVSTIGVALGSLAAGLPTVIQDVFHTSPAFSFKTMFLFFVALMVVLSLLYRSLSPTMDGRFDERRWINPLKLPSRRIILPLIAIFSVDQFASGLIVQSLVVYWFFTKFGIELGGLALIFFTAQLLAVISLWLSAKIANRIGLLKTMVFTHIPASVLLIAIAFAPIAWMAVIFWQLRSLLNQMDVPTRDSYTLAIVRPEERVTMVSLRLGVRSINQTIGPSVGTALWNAISSSAPFVFSGVLKIVYDISLYMVFRKVKPPEEIQKAKLGADMSENQESL